MKQIKLDDFYKHNYLSALTYAPNGKKAAYIVKRIDPKENKYLSDIYLYEKGAHTRLTTEGDVKFFCFADDRTLLFAATRGKQMEEAEKKGSIFTAFFRLDILSKKASKLFQLPIQASSITPIGKDNFLLKATIDLAYPDFYLLDAKEQKKIIDRVQADKDYEVLEESPFWFNGRGFVSGKRGAIFIYNAKKNRLTRLNDPNIDVNSFAFDAENVYYSGENRTAEAKDKQGVYSYSIANGTTEQILNERYSIYSIHSLGNKLIAIATDKKRFGESENPYFYAIDKKTGDVKVLTAADESLGANVLTDVLLGETRSTKVDGDYLYFVAVDRYHAHLKRIDLDGDIETLIKKDGAIADFDVSKSNVIAMGLFDMKLPELYELRKDELVCISDYNALILQDKYVAEPQYLSVRSESFDIDGWVLLPKDYDPEKKYPAILDIHGGPKCAYGPIYFHEMQAWANDGYFVFFCNPIGSDGRGNVFADLRLKWGGPDYKNIMDFTNAVLKAYPAIDAKKVCATGGSYGGYMCNWILTHTDKFCAIATQRSISNWLTMYGVSDIGPNFGDETFEGDLYEDKKAFTQVMNVSPIKYVSKAVTPTLFIHSDEDYRCPVEEGYQLMKALIHKGVPTRMCLFHGENHELSRSGKPTHRLRRLTEITNWFAKYAK